MNASIRSCRRKSSLGRIHLHVSSRNRTYTHSRVPPRVYASVVAESGKCARCRVDGTEGRGRGRVATAIQRPAPCLNAAILRKSSKSTAV
jgi:hypothetical protein